jgi:hypothetical protein
MKRKIWKMHQESRGGYNSLTRWFVFLDTDTFVEWENLLVLLNHLDDAKPIYIGSPVWLPKLQFAHGGSAYVLSYGAMKALNAPETHDKEQLLYSQFGFNTTALCCGDEALARVLKSKGVSLRGYWPMFNGEIPAGISFGRDLWCEPVISLHHLGGEDMQDLWQWIEKWKVRTISMVGSPFSLDYHLYVRKTAASTAISLTTKQQPFLFKDLFQYVAPQIISTRGDWDNIQESMKIFPKYAASHISFETCKAACELDSSCFQFVYNGTTCALSDHIRVGSKRSVEGNPAQTYVSGWMIERIRDWTMKTHCASAHWLHSNP